MDISVIVPTNSRLEFLKRAVDSALASIPPLEGEVIICVNGDYDYFNSVHAHFKNFANIKFTYTANSNACLARNLGISAAVGKYIRFLDDDDELYPIPSNRQLEIAINSNADVVSATIHFAGDSGATIGVWTQPEKIRDFTVASFSKSRMCQVTAHVFKLEAVKGTIWDESLPYAQDVCWFLALASKREYSWIKLNEPVGKWHRHTGHRISLRTNEFHRKKIISDTLQKYALGFKTDSLLTSKKKSAIFESLMLLSKQGWLSDPAYWSRVIFFAFKLKFSNSVNMFIVGALSAIMILYAGFFSSMFTIRYLVKITLLRMHKKKYW